jgi:hypothetical protein
MKTKKECEYCSNLISCCEGDFICLEGDDTKLVITDYEPAEDYMWCGGKKWNQG